MRNGSSGFQVQHTLSRQLPRIFCRAISPSSSQQSCLQLRRSAAIQGCPPSPNCACPQYLDHPTCSKRYSQPLPFASLHATYVAPLAWTALESGPCRCTRVPHTSGWPLVERQHVLHWLRLSGSSSPKPREN